MKVIITSFLLGFCTFLGAQGLVINEIVASNDSTSMIADDFGDYDDWVELYNNSNETIDMSGYYFSDDASEPDKWRFPNGISIPGDGYLIVWTDSDNGQGDLHTSFKLAKSGEHLVLSDSFLVVVDSLTFGEQETNVSFARIPNGTGNFTPRAPSFNQNNENTGVFVQALNVRKDFELAPNPAQSSIQLDFTKTEDFHNSSNALIEISDISGKLLLRQSIDALSNNALITLDINSLNIGLHILKVYTESDIFLKKFIVAQND